MHPDHLKDCLHSQGLSRQERVLMCLYALSNSRGKISEIKGIAIRYGLREVSKWNLSAILGAMKGLAVSTPNGWELTSAGKASAIALSGGGPALVNVQANALRAEVEGITGEDARQFLLEAVTCLEHRLYRAAVVLSWVGAIAVLYDHVCATCLPQFNAEATTRDAKWRIAQTPDDLARMKESVFLDVLEKISVIGKSVKGELDACLKLRNGCGHPNSLTIRESRVAAHIEILVLNIFQKF